MAATRLLRFQEDINPKPILNSDTHEHIPIYEQLHKQGKENFKNTWYWSSLQGASGIGAYNVGFGNGYVYYYSKSNYCQVRAVRSKP